jgi:hypothetical protein
MTESRQKQGCRQGLANGCGTTQADRQATSRASTSPYPIRQTQVQRPLVAVAPVSLSLSGEWRFAADPDAVGKDEGWADPKLDDADWEAVTVPHTWNGMEHHTDYHGMAWYRRFFMLPADAKGAHVRVHFEAVCYLAHVWLNGEYLGAHEGGYTPFEFDVSEIVRQGVENVIAVQADNLRAADRIPALYGWQLYGGIVRDVSIELTTRAFIARQQVVAIPHLVAVDEASAATISATVTIHNTSTQQLEGVLRADVLQEASGSSVLDSLLASSVSISAGQSADVELVTTISSPSLWHFDHPNLYRWSASLHGAHGEALHIHRVTLGIRLVELKQARFYLNGEPLRLVGLSRHADVPGFGLAEPAAVMTADWDDLKLLNMVFGRPVHYPQHEFILDYCDRRGILLIPELPAWQLSAAQMADSRMRRLAQQQLCEMIAADFNHPSVWAWSIGNELESDTAAGRAFVRDMIAFVKSLDPTRPVGFASYHLLVGRPWADATQFADFVMMNQYFGTWHGPKDGLGLALDTIHLAWPDKTVIVSEYGFCPHSQTIEGPAQIDPAQYYYIAQDVPSGSEEADVQRQRVIADQIQVFRSKPFVSGALFWCYRHRMGVVDGAGNRRGSWWLLREEYSPVLIQSVTFAPAVGSARCATVKLRTRGPVEQDLPAYTLRGYRLRWVVTSPERAGTFAEEGLTLPTLAPGSEWTGEIEWAMPEADHILILSIVRPTGSSVIERAYDPHGSRLSTR